MNEWGLILDRDEVIRNALAAKAAADSGSEHQYLEYSLRGQLYRINREAAFFPLCPVDLLPQSRRRTDGKQNPEPWKT